MPRSKKNSPSRPPKKTRNSDRFITKSEVKGGKYTPSTNPPDVNAQPWNNYTLMDTFEGSHTYTVSDIAKYFKLRFDPTKFGLNQSPDFRMQYKIVSIACWNLTGRFITLSVEDYGDTESSKTGRDQLCGLLDSGTQLHTPAVGYRLPLSVRNCVLRNDDKQGNVCVFHSQGGNSDVCLVHIHMQWRLDGPVTPPSVSVSTLNDVNSGLNSLKDIAETLKQIAEQNERSKPSTVHKVVDGVSRLAMLVASSAADDDVSLLSDLESCLEHFSTSPKGVP